LRFRTRRDHAALIEHHRIWKSFLELFGLRRQPRRALRLRGAENSDTDEHRRRQHHSHRDPSSSREAFRRASIAPLTTSAKATVVRRSFSEGGSPRATAEGV